MQDEVRTPDHEAVVRDLRLLRERGLGAIRRINLPALHQAALACGLATVDDQGPAAIENLLRRAVKHLDGGDYEESASYTFGLISGTKLAPSSERRRQAAKVFSVIPDTFRKTYEKTLIDEVAEGVLALCHEQAMRVTHLRMERRHPADSRLAVAWVERFEAYYRLWTPIYALGADLKAALQMYSEEPADHLPWDPDSQESFDPVKEAQGYARSALYWYANYHLELKRFMRERGGLWLFSDAQVESDIRDAVYRVGWHNPINEEDDSWLRRKLADSRHEEAQQFYRSLEASQDGERIHATWQEFVLKGYQQSESAEEGENQLLNAIRACDFYCEWVDRDWLKIADWYSPGSPPPRGISADQLFGSLVEE
ncbi:hypothetical protein R4227_18600 [Gordonia amicalis]|uniref:hypothetical protein n=1 Tax=Gordonia amicalis TaxID=89053 RepID=UPI00295489EE|nr:hypothetical protein [Gordonia amicalis]MDV7102072.1 hypothetical protein [Gordonia amicalis]